jgi:hypothetical protein
MKWTTRVIIIVAVLLGYVLANRYFDGYVEKTVTVRSATKTKPRFVVPDSAQKIAARGKPSESIVLTRQQAVREGAIFRKPTPVATTQLVKKAELKKLAKKLVKKKLVKKPKLKLRST